MKIGKIKGIKIKLHFSTLIIMFLIGLNAAIIYYDFSNGNAYLIDLIIIGVLNGFLILLSILIHEIMHSLYAQHFGLKVKEIELYIFGGVSKIEEEPKTPKHEFIIAAVGPGTSLLIGAIFLLIIFLPIQLPLIIFFTFLYIGITNIILGFFNLIPAFPMDGGRILRAFLWQHRGDLLSATRTSSNVGIFFGYLFIIIGFFEIFFFGIIDGFWLILIGFLIVGSAREAYRDTYYLSKLSNLRVYEIADNPIIAIPFNIFISDAIFDFFMTYKKPFFPVIKDNKRIGIVHISDIKKVPYSERDNVIIGDITRKISELPTIYGDETGRAALIRLRQIKNKPFVLAVRERLNENVLGFIGEKEINLALRTL
ncbi:MAG: site-2 protease family protein [Promethearchaeota archaeon]